MPQLHHSHHKDQNNQQSRHVDPLGSFHSETLYNNHIIIITIDSFFALSVLNSPTNQSSINSTESPVVHQPDSIRSDTAVGDL
mmetsp:Transcript_12869/g.25905  ORF Transcript_12869/g.25905 Transcript_12869/m.25905 type:complete len:83 (+) Transcript_12869:42-290(+)